MKLLKYIRFSIRDEGCKYYVEELKDKKCRLIEQDLESGEKKEKIVKNMTEAKNLINKWIVKNLENCNY